MVSELGKWMDWDSKEFREFLKQFYSDKLELSAEIGPVMELQIAVFDKIAPPAVYLQHEYKKWREQSKKAQPRQVEKTETATPWRRSNNNPDIEWCPANEAMASDVSKAERNEGGMWYRPPQGSFKHGSIFRRVGNGK